MNKKVIFRKSDLYLMALLWKMICDLRDAMSCVTSCLICSCNSCHTSMNPVANEHIIYTIYASVVVHPVPEHTVTRCNTLQHAASLCNIHRICVSPSTSCPT